MDIFLIFLRLKTYLWGKCVEYQYHPCNGALMPSSTCTNEDNDSTTSRDDSWSCEFNSIF
jgi:hypothetical protein